jgi:ADP-ribosylglycohydrolase
MERYNFLTGSLETEYEENTMTYQVPSEKELIATGWYGAVQLYGAAIGDICGSIYEFKNFRTDRPEEIELINNACYFTDDTILTAAIAVAMSMDSFSDASTHGEKRAILLVSRRFSGASSDAKKPQELYSKALWEWGNRYSEPIRAYGTRFQEWLWDPKRKPYGSYGNGAAMRISAIPQLFHRTYQDNYTIEGLLEEVRLATVPTHGHPEGIKGAQATAVAILLGWLGKSKEEIKKAVVGRFGYNLDRTLSEIRPTYGFDETCQGTVPVAITAFLESHDFVSAIQNAISVGGDSDTIAAITGSIAEAYYKEIPEDLKVFARGKLPDNIKQALGMTE